MVNHNVIILPKRVKRLKSWWVGWWFSSTQKKNVFLCEEIHATKKIIFHRDIVVTSQTPWWHSPKSGKLACHVLFVKFMLNPLVLEELKHIDWLAHHSIDKLLGYNTNVILWTSVLNCPVVKTDNAKQLREKRPKQKYARGTRLQFFCFYYICSSCLPLLISCSGLRWPVLSNSGANLGAIVRQVVGRRGGK